MDGVKSLLSVPANGPETANTSTKIFSGLILSKDFLLLEVQKQAGWDTKEPFELRLVVLTSASHHLKAQYLGDGLLLGDRIVLYEAHLSTATLHAPLVLTSCLDRTRFQEDPGTQSCASYSHQTFFECEPDKARCLITVAHPRVHFGG